MRTTVVRPRMLGWLGLLATVAVAGCTATSTSGPAEPGASFLPSRTASDKVLVGFQDGASIGLFVRAARSGWQVQLGGEPVVCAEVPFFPPAMLMAWSLPADTAVFGCSSRPARQVSSGTFAVTISIPGDWQPTPDLGADRFGYDGPSGWVQLNAMAEPSGLRHACTAAATGDVLQPFGLHPQIIYRNVDGRPGCLIFPSSDAPRRAHRTGYPAFQDSAALVEYRQPVSAGGGGCLTPTGQQCLYSLLIIYADPAHLAAIVDSVQLHH